MHQVVSKALTRPAFANEGGDIVVAEAGAGTEGHGGLDELANYTGTAVWTGT